MSVVELVRARGLWLLMVLALAMGGCLKLETEEETPSEDPPTEEPPGEEEPPAEEPPAEGTLRIEIGAATLLVQEGGSGPLTVHLSEAPESSVTIVAELIGGSGFTLEPSEITFSTSDWNEQKSFTVSSAADGDAQNDWGRVRLSADGLDSRTVDITQQDTEGDPVSSAGVGLKVKDAAGAGAFGWPVTAVVPLEYGKFQSTDGFRMLGPDGDPVPAQFAVLNRWWARDGSIRHVTVQFQATVAPDGQSIYTFETTGGNVAPADRVQVTDGASTITVDTGAIRFTIKKTGFNMFDEVWLDTDGDGNYSSGEKIVSSNDDAGPVFTGRNGVQRPRDRNDLRIVVEESGPMRAVIRVAANAIFNDTDDHTHGFAMRFYAYAGKPFVKVDYQLQNSAKNARLSWPLYFEDMALHLKPNLSNPTLRLAPGPGNVWSGTVGGGRHLFQKDQQNADVRNSGNNSVLKSGSNPRARSSYGWADLSDSQRGVFVTIRHMSEMFPNGIEVMSDNDIALRLWPKWSSQWHENAFSSSGLYWLEDMQHVYKETLFYFHGPDASNDELDAVAKNFQQSPIPFVPTGWYHQTAVTLDLDGIMPSAEPDARGEDQKEVYHHYEETSDPSNVYYNFSSVDFGGDTGRRSSGNAGGIPYGGSRIMGSERVDMWMTTEVAAIGEINCRPIWMENYKVEDDLERLALENYVDSPVTWRAKDVNTAIAAPYLPGTAWNRWTPLDNSHAWTYHLEDFYYASANLWLRDWYEFQAEFRRSERSIAPPGYTSWLDKVRFYDNIRGEAHSWYNLLAAYRVTGDVKVLEQIRARLRENLWTNRSEQYGCFNVNFEAAFQLGYLGRVMIQIMTETRYGDDRQLHDEAFQILWGIVEWNRNMSGFGNYIDSRNHTPLSAGSSPFALPMIPPVAWFGLNTGSNDHLNLVREYMTDGLNGGRAADGPTMDWSNDFWGYETNGGWIGRLGEYVTKYSIAPNPPAAITDLAASRSGDGVKVEWRTPSRAARFHVVWSTRPIVGEYNPSESVCNAWAAKPVGNTLVARPGERQSLTFEGVPSGRTIYVAVYTFDEEKSMSAISNVASVTIP